jgi:hypothetical protein
MHAYVGAEKKVIRPAMARISVALLAFMMLLLASAWSRAQDCGPLDPRPISAKAEQDIALAVKAIWRISGFNVDFKNITEKEVNNLYHKYPEAKKTDLNDRLIYLFCTTLKTSKDLTTDQRSMKVMEFSKYIAELTDPHQSGNPRIQINNTVGDIKGDGNTISQQGTQTTPIAPPR